MSTDILASYEECKRQLAAQQWTAALETAVAIRAKFGDRDEPDIALHVARSRLLHLQALIGLGQKIDAHRLCQELIGDTRPEFQAIALEAAFVQASRLSNETRDAVKTLTAIFETPTASDVEVRRIQAKAGSRLIEMQSDEDEMEYDEDGDPWPDPEGGGALFSSLLERFGADPDADVLVSVNEAIRFRLRTLAWLDTSESVDEAEELAARQWGQYAKHSDVRVQEQVLQTHVDYAGALYLPARELPIYARLREEFDGRANPEMQRWLARIHCLNARALAKSDPPRTDAAFEELKTLRSRFATSPDEDVQLQVVYGYAQHAELLRNQGNPQDAAAVLREQIDYLGSLASTPALRRATATAWQSLSHVWKRQIPEGLQRHDQHEAMDEPELLEAEREYANAVMHLFDAFAKDTEYSNRHAAASAMYDLAATYRERRHLAAAEETYKKYLSAFAKDEAFAQTTASAYLNLGFLLFKLVDGREEEALAVYDEMAERFKNANTPSLRDTLAKGNASRLSCVNFLRREGKDAAYGEQYDDLPVDEINAIRDTANEARSLGEQGKHREAIVLLDGILAKYADSVHPDLRMRCSDAMASKGYHLGCLSQREEALAVNEQLIAMYGDELSTTIQKDVALALSNKAVQLDKLGRPLEEIKVYDEIIRRYIGSSVAYMRERVAKAFYAKAFTLAQDSVGNVPAAIVQYQTVVDRYLTDEQLICRVQAFYALHNLGHRYRLLGRFDEAVEAYSKLVSAAESESDSRIRTQYVKARTGLARCYFELKQTDLQIEHLRYLLALPESELDAGLRTKLTHELQAAKVTQMKSMGVVGTLKSLFGKK